MLVFLTTVLNQIKSAPNIDANTKKQSNVYSISSVENFESNYSNGLRWSIGRFFDICSTIER